VEATVWGSKH